VELNLPSFPSRPIGAPSEAPISIRGDPLKYEALTFQPPGFRHSRLTTKAQLRSQSPPPPLIPPSPKSRLSIHQSCSNPATGRRLERRHRPERFSFSRLRRHGFPPTVGVALLLLPFSSPQDSRPHSSTMAKDLII
jgi:hypothetical protein